MFEFQFIIGHNLSSSFPLKRNPSARMVIIILFCVLVRKKNLFSTLTYVKKLQNKSLFFLLVAERVLEMGFLGIYWNQAENGFKVRKLGFSSFFCQIFVIYHDF